MNKKLIVALLVTCLVIMVFISACDDVPQNANEAYSVALDERVNQMVDGINTIPTANEMFFAESSQTTLKNATARSLTSDGQQDTQDEWDWTDVTEKSDAYNEFDAYAYYCAANWAYVDSTVEDYKRFKEEAMRNCPTYNVWHDSYRLSYDKTNDSVTIEKREYYYWVECDLTIPEYKRIVFSHDAEGRLVINAATISQRTPGVDGLYQKDNYLYYVEGKEFVKGELRQLYQRRIDGVMQRADIKEIIYVNLASPTVDAKILSSRLEYDEDGNLSDFYGTTHSEEVLWIKQKGDYIQTVRLMFGDVFDIWTDYFTLDGQRVMSYYFAYYDGKILDHEGEINLYMLDGWDSIAYHTGETSHWLNSSFVIGGETYVGDSSHSVPYWNQFDERTSWIPSVTFYYYYREIYAPYIHYVSLKGADNVLEMLQSLGLSFNIDFDLEQMVQSLEDCSELEDCTAFGYSMYPLLTTEMFGEIYDEYFHTFTDEEFNELIKDDENVGNEQSADEVLLFVKIEIQGNVTFDKDFKIDFSQIKIVVTGGVDLLADKEIFFNVALQNDKEIVTLLKVKCALSRENVSLDIIDKVDLSNLSVRDGKYRLIAYLTDDNDERISVTVDFNCDGEAVMEMVIEKLEHLGDFDFLHSVKSKFEGNKGCFFSVFSTKTFVEDADADGSKTE